MKRKKIINNKNLNSLLKNTPKNIKSKAKIKSNNDSLIISNENILYQNYNINGNYKSIYYFDDENFNKENIFYNNKINIKHYFTFKDSESENNINRYNTSKKQEKINNNNSYINKNNFTLNVEDSIDQNQISQINNINTNGFNNSYKIINESKYNNKSKVTIYLISDKKINDEKKNEVDYL